MFGFIKKNKLNLNFGKSIKETSDLLLEKDEDIIKLHIGDTILSNEEAETFDLTVNATDTSVIVKKGEQTISQGADVLSDKDEIIITATPIEGYTLSVLTVNGSEFTSGSSYTITSDVVIVATSVQGTAE